MARPKSSRNATSTSFAPLCLVSVAVSFLIALTIAKLEPGSKLSAATPVKKEPWPMPCAASAIRFWEAQRSCERRGQKTAKPWMGRAVPKRRERFRAMCMETSWIITTSKDIRYMHMPSLALLPDGHTILAAWQASPAREGETMQTLMSAVSQNDGRKWTQRRHVVLQGPPYTTGSVAAPQAWGQVRRRGCAAMATSSCVLWHVR